MEITIKSMKIANIKLKALSAISTEYKKACEESNLIADDSFWAASESDISSNFNGAGPDHFDKFQDLIIVALTGSDDPDSTGRKFLSDLLSLFILAFVIHDWDCRDGRPDKSEAAFHVVNNRMRGNMKILLDARYPFWKFWSWAQRSYWWTLILITHKACESKEGLRAWKD